MILVTGGAGFIGAHVLAALAARGTPCVGLDNFNDYYDVQLKHDRVRALLGPHGVQIEKADLVDEQALRAVFERHRVRRVIHLAAQAGVRYSMVNPRAYLQSNLVGFGNILECCRHFQAEHLVYASSSSVYGSNARLPWDESDSVDHPVSLYAATKASNELLAHSYSHLYGLPCTGLRFFTVYGPWGRPDMAPSLFSRAILRGEPIRVFNHGQMERDFTYVDDIARAVCRVVDKPATADPAFDPMAPTPATSSGPFRIFNIGNHMPASLQEFIALLEQAYGVPAIRQLEAMQPGDVRATYAAIERLDAWIGFSPSTPLAEGLQRFAAWYKAYHGGADRASG